MGRRILLVALGLSLVAQTPAPKPAANLNQLMRGVFYPPANVVFFAQSDNPGEVKRPPGQDPSMATDPLISTFGGWQAVENAALALTESANLLLVPGRICSNGVTAPVADAEWIKFAGD